jgi:hypothetical protein
MILRQLNSANSISGRWLVLVMEKLYVYCDTETEFLNTIGIHFLLKVINFYLFASVGFIIFIRVNCIYSRQSHAKERYSSGSLVVPCQLSFYHCSILIYWAGAVMC